MRMTNLHDVHTAGSRRVLGGFSESSRRFSSIFGVFTSDLGVSGIDPSTLRVLSPAS